MWSFQFGGKVKGQVLERTMERSEILEGGSMDRGG